MRTRSSSNLLVESPPNPSTSNPKRRNGRRSKQPFILEESLVDMMADQRTMVELLRAPTEGYAEAIVLPSILAEQFELKHSLINMMTSDQFFELEKDNPHDHIHWFNKITFTIKYKDVPNSAIKLMLFPFSLAGEARRWLEKEPPRSILTWEDLAWDRYKDLLRACPHYGFTELHQLDTFYNALNPADQDSLNSAAGGNLLERRTQDVLTIIEKKSKCLTAGGNTFPELWDNIQGYVAAAAVNYNQGNSGYCLREKLLELANTPLNENCSAVIRKKLLEKLRDPGKFLISCGFSELKCKALVNLGASINLMPLSVWKKLGLPKLISTRMTLELANRAICTPAGIARDVFIPVGKFTFLVDFVIVDYESDPRVLLILGKPFLRTSRALIDVHGEEMILRNGDERLTLNMRHDTSSYSSQPKKESINVINIFCNAPLHKEDVMS
nr:reverse transcriptase domain-containing protein [Tanacetum cinerariifolium]